MPRIISVGTTVPENIIDQEQTMQFVRQLYTGKVENLPSLLQVFVNGEINKRHFAKTIDWYQEKHSFSEQNNAFIEAAVDLSVQAIQNCLHANSLERNIAFSEIDAIFMISTTGLSTPSLDAHIMNRLPFHRHTKRIPIWGLGCAGGAAGLSRAYEYCRAFPHAKVVVVAVELCSLTFQLDDISKRNIVGTSLFADGAASVLVGGDEVHYTDITSRPLPNIIDTQSTLLENSIDVMGWDVKDSGLHVIFSKSIPEIVGNWLEPEVVHLLDKNHLSKANIAHFIAHPGGRKVITAYEEALNLPHEKMDHSLHILKEYGNMSSPTVLFVLERFMNDVIRQGEHGIIAALGPGFSSELLLVRWE